MHNDGYDDQNYDYILVGDEIFNDRYILKHRMGRVSVFSVLTELLPMTVFLSLPPACSHRALLAKSSVPTIK